MSRLSRAFLLALSVVFVLVLVGMGTSFTHSAESPEKSQGVELVWLSLAALFATPLWLPAALPNAWRSTSIVVRWICAGVLLIPIWYASGVALHQAQMVSSQFFSVTILAGATLLDIGFVAAIVVLLAPEFKRRHHDASG